MKKILLISFIIILGCGYSEDFKTKAGSLLYDSRILSKNIGQSNYFVVSRFYNDTKISWERVIPIWPENKLQKEKKHFENAIEASRILITLWGQNIAGMEDPIEPNLNNYEVIDKYAKTNNKIIQKVGSSGRKYYPMQNNIQVLLTIIDDEFKNGISGLERAIK